MRPVLIVFAGLLVTGTAAGQIFECIDAKGSKEYAQFCAPGTVKATPVLRNAPAAKDGSEATPATPASSPTEQDVAFRKRELERKEAEEKAAKENAAAEIAQKNCEEARGRLRGFQEGQRLTRYDPDTGETYVMDDDMRPAELAVRQKAVDFWCKR